VLGFSAVLDSDQQITSPTCPAPFENVSAWIRWTVRADRPDNCEP
jgi:hypothetical protein